MKRKLGPLETQFFSYAQMRRLRTVRTGDLVEALRMSPVQERELLTRMSRARLIAQVRRGLYLVPPRLPLGGAWRPDDELVLWALMEDKQGGYQICGPNAFNRYGYDGQVPTRVYAYNNRMSGDRTIGSVRLTLIKVSDERLGSTEEIRAESGVPVIYSSRARTLVDAVYDWSRFNSLPRAYGWMDEELAAGRVEVSTLASLAVQYGDIGTIRRMGAFLETRGTAGRALSGLERALTPTRGSIPFNPAAPKRGTLNRRWGVVINAR